MRTHYHNLKVNEKASYEEIRQAYKRLSQHYHPDKNKNSPESVRAFALIQRAYEVLKSPSSRIKHNVWIQKNIQDQKRKKHSALTQSSLSAQQLHEKRQNAYRTMVYRKVLEAKHIKIEHQKQLAIRRNIFRQSLIRSFYCILIVVASSIVAYDSDKHAIQREEVNITDTYQLESAQLPSPETLNNYESIVIKEEISKSENNNRNRYLIKSTNQFNKQTEVWVRENVF